jgi:thiamine biosynthesis lipoprotein
MASDAHVILVDPADGAEEYARRRLEKLERRWSRFLPESDVSRLNTAPEALMLVSSDTVSLLATMKEGWRVTGGRYDPTVLAAVIAAGYSTSIDGSGRTSRMAGRPTGGLTVCDVSIDPATSAVMVPCGVGLDPGGIGKGLAADLVVTELLAAGTSGALVSVGGDLAAAGTPPTAAGWHVNVQHPLDATRDLVTLALSAGGVATSSTRTRTWVRGGRRHHHAIDPATQTCSRTDLAAATVVARAGWEAEAHATAALLCGSGHVLDYFVRHGLAGLATTLDGVTMTSPGLGDGHVLEGNTT